MVFKKKVSCSAHKGFTLMEVLVVVLIIGVLAAIAYPVYSKSVQKARATEAVVLVELVKGKQLAKLGQSGIYFKDFENMGRLSNSKEEQSGATLKVNDAYIVSLNDDESCVTVKYKDAFAFSGSYARRGLGCTGNICDSFGEILGEVTDVCNCADKQCDVGLTLNPDTCACECKAECFVDGVCGGPSINKEMTRTCPNGTVQTRACQPDCNGGTCEAFEPCPPAGCSGPDYTRLESCGNCGSMNITMSCDSASGEWRESGRTECVLEGVCKSGNTEKAADSSNVSGATRTCGSSCQWGPYTCGSGKEVIGSLCYTPCPTTCPAGYKRSSYPYVEIQSNCCILDVCAPENAQCQAGEEEQAPDMSGAIGAKRTCNTECKWTPYTCEAGREIAGSNCYTPCPTTCPAGYERTSYPYVEIQADCCRKIPSSPQIKSGTFVANCDVNWGAGVSDPGVKSYSWCKDGLTTRARDNPMDTVACASRTGGYCEHPSFNDYKDYMCVYVRYTYSLPETCPSDTHSNICASKGKGYVCKTGSVYSSCRYSTENYCHKTQSGCVVAPSSTNKVFTSNTGSFDYLECM